MTIASRMVATRKVTARRVSCQQHDNNLAWANKAVHVICGGWGFSFGPGRPFSRSTEE